MQTALFVTALLALYPTTPARRCIERNAARIAAVAQAGHTADGVPPGVLLAVGFFETHLGCDVGEGGGWGAPIDARHRHTAGTPGHAARALARSFRVCGTWEGAIGRFRSGLCRPWQAAHRTYVARVLRCVVQLTAAAGASLPPSFHAP